MRAKILQIVIVLVFILVCSTCSTKTVRQSSDIETEIIDFSSFKRIETDNIPERIIKNASFVKLDYSSEDILFREIDILKIVDNRIFILDIRLRKLVVFDSTGTGLGKVGNQGQGPEEYLRIHDFCVSDEGDIYLRDGTRNNVKLYSFDKDFRFVSAKPLPFSVNHVHKLVNDKFIFALHSWNKGNNASTQIVITDEEFNTEKSFLQFDENIDENMVIGTSTFASSADRILYHKSINNFVYEFSNEGEPLKTYFFDFGNKDVPNNDRKDIEGNWENFKLYSCIRNIALINDKYIAGTLFDERIPKPFIVDRIENCIYIFYNEEKGVQNGMLWCYENSFILPIHSGMYEDIQSTNLPHDVKEHLENEGVTLCLYELK